MAETIMVSIPVGVELRKQLRHVWRGMPRRADEQPLERLALAQLGVSKDLTDATRNLAREPYAYVKALLDRCRANSAMRNASPMFVVGLVIAMIDATIDDIASGSTSAERHAAIGFEAL